MPTFIGMEVTGSYEMVIFEKGKRTPISEDLHEEISADLAKGNLIVSMDKKTIAPINDLENPIYRFKLVPLDNTEYEFSTIYWD